MMKKEFALAGMIAAGVALTSTSVLAGTQTFTANIDDSTCVIANLDQTVDLGTMLKSELQSLGKWGGYKNTPVTFKVTGCGSSLKTVHVTLNGSMDNSLGIATQVFDISTIGMPAGAAQPNGAAWGSGTSKDFALTNGTSDVPLDLWTSRYRTSNIVDGAYNQVYNFTFDFS
ncbi:hypothetical protein GCQ95_23545 [Salmonella enterica subsp. salamae]|nr:hypothetical protein [Salmonella enterica subsp. salamae]